ncbi:MAG: hypothetical protein HY077_15820 [Elusimicrobia bacterium]|nr:hypothetical protein [Elusimicrobiota bacterium]
MEKIKIRGLAHISSWILGAWGTMVALKSLYDLFGGEPEANLYAPRKWAFVTQEQWLRYGGFELCYGLSLLALSWALRRYARSLPAVVSRPKRGPEFQLFD